MPAIKEINDLPTATQKAPSKPSKTAKTLNQRESRKGENGNITSQVNERTVSGTKHTLTNGSVLVNH